MIRLAIVDEHANVRQYLRDFLQSCPGMSLVAEGRNAAQATQIATEVAPDVLLMDWVMPGQNGVDALAALRSFASHLPVLIPSGYPEKFCAHMLLQRGAAGLVHKTASPSKWRSPFALWQRACCASRLSWRAISWPRPPKARRPSTRTPRPRWRQPWPISCSAAPAHLL